MEDESLNDLEDLKIAPSQYPDCQARRIEVLSRRDAAISMAIFVLSNAIIIACFLNFPPHVITKEYDISRNSTKNTEVMVFNLSDIGPLNQFLELSLKFSRQKSAIFENGSAQISIVTQLYSGSEMIYEHHLPIQSYVPKFEGNSSIAEPLRVFFSPYIYFDRISSVASIKFPPSSDNDVSVKFQWAFNDSSDQLLNIIIRIVFCSLSIIISIQFFLQRNCTSEATFSKRSVIFLLLSTMVASNPLEIANFFVPSPIIQVCDAVAYASTFVLSSFLGLISLSFGDVINIPISKFFLSSIPFALVFVLSMLRFVPLIKELKTNPLLENNHSKFFVRLMNAADLSIVTLCIFSASKRRKMDQFVHSMMLGAFLLMHTFLRVVGSKQKLLIDIEDQRVFSFAANGCFSMFFAYFNWPIDPNEVEASIGRESGEIGIE